MVYGIALVFGTTGLMNFEKMPRWRKRILAARSFCWGSAGAGGAGFQDAAFPSRCGAGCFIRDHMPHRFPRGRFKAAGFVLLLRVLFQACPRSPPVDDAAHCDFDAHDPLRQSLRHSPAQPQRLLATRASQHGYLLMVPAAAAGPDGRPSLLLAVIFYAAGCVHRDLPLLRKVGSDMRA